MHWLISDHVIYTDIVLNMATLEHMDNITLLNKATQEHMENITSFNISLNFSFWEGILNDHFASPPSDYLVFVILYIPAFIVGLVGNGLLALIVICKRRFRSMTNYFLCNLAFADLAGKYWSNACVCCCNVLSHNFNTYAILSTCLFKCSFFAFWNC